MALLIHFFKPTEKPGNKLILEMSFTGRTFIGNCSRYDLRGQVINCFSSHVMKRIKLCLQNVNLNQSHLTNPFKFGIILNNYLSSMLFTTSMKIL